MCDQDEESCLESGVSAWEGNFKKKNMGIEIDKHDRELGYEKLEKKNVCTIIWITGYNFSDHGCLKSLLHESEQQERHLKHETIRFWLRA